MDIRSDSNDTLTPERAADLLGVSPRTVRRWIGSGKLTGTTVPCATTRAAVDALRRQQQARGGEVVATDDTIRDSADKGGHDDRGTAGVMDAADVAYVIDMLAARGEDLARQVGRLEAEVARLRGQRGPRAQRGEGGRRQNGHKGHDASALSRLVPWLRG